MRKHWKHEAEHEAMQAKKSKARRSIAASKHRETTTNTMSSCNFEELVGPTLLIGKGQEVYTKDLLKDKKYVM